MIATAEPVTLPGPGVYVDYDAEAYHALPYLSKSKLWRFKQLLDVCYTLEDLDREMRRERPDTDALTFGRAFDDFLFYPHRANEMYEVGPTATRRAKAFQEAQANTDKTLLTPDEIELIPAMVDSILSHPLGNQLIVGHRGANQLSLVWDDERTGVRCKGRVDRLTCFIDPDQPDAGEQSAHVDVKTCRDLDYFHKDALAFGYPLQAAMYRDGAETIDRLKGRTPHHRRFVFLVVEKTPSREAPGRHRVATFEYDAMQIDSMLRIRDVLLAKWVRYQRGEYPGDPVAVKPLYIPESYENAYGDLRD